MSTLKTNSSAERLAILAATGNQLFHLDDLATLWGMENKNTLRVTLYRYLKAGWLHAIHRGLYSLVPVAQLSPSALGTACLHQYCYLTAETVLRDEGIILQTITDYTFVSAQSRRWSAAGHRFSSRQLKSQYLHHPAGITKQAHYFKASPIRAVADLLYFDPWYHFDQPLDWAAVKAMQTTVGYPLTPARYATA